MEKIEFMGTEEQDTHLRELAEKCGFTDPRTQRIDLINNALDFLAWHQKERAAGRGVVSMITEGGQVISYKEVLLPHQEPILKNPVTDH